MRSSVFNADTCKLCGACVIGCPFTEVTASQAKEEIVQFIRTRRSRFIMKNCAGCGYCNTICPTQSGPSDLRNQIRLARTAQTGSSCMTLMREDVPENIMTVGLKHNRAEKEKALQVYMNPPKSEAAFYIGCAISYIYTDLTKTKLLDDLPVLGGMKYCCGGYIRNKFGDEEAKIWGEQLLQALRDLGLNKLITFCPECMHMLKEVYPELVPGFDLEIQSIAEYILEKYQEGEIAFPNRLNKRITIHDSCAFRAMQSDIYETPRKLIALLGAQVVEMKHNRKKSWCCGAPLVGVNPLAADRIAEKRIAEAVAAGAEAIAVSCSGCFALIKKATESHLDVFNIIELVQIAIGEDPPHRIREEMDQIANNFIQTVSDTPDLLNKRYKIEGGESVELGTYPTKSTKKISQFRSD